MRLIALPAALLLALTACAAETDSEAAATPAAAADSQTEAVYGDEAPVVIPAAPETTDDHAHDGEHPEHGDEHEHEHDHGDGEAPHAH